MDLKSSKLLWKLKTKPNFLHKILILPFIKTYEFKFSLRVIELNCQSYFAIIIIDTIKEKLTKLLVIIWSRHNFKAHQI